MSAFEWVRPSTRGFWKLDGDGADESPYNNGADTSDIRFSSGKLFWQCGKFTGIHGASIGAGLTELRPANIAIMAWFKTTSTGDWRMIYANSDWPLGGEGIGCYLGCSYQKVWLGFYYGDGSDLNMGSLRYINDGDWHWVVAATSSSGSDLYVDGRLESTSSELVPPNYTGACESTIGMISYPSNPFEGYYFIGSIGPMCILNAIPTQQDVARMYAFQMGWI